MRDAIRWFKCKLKPPKKADEKKVVEKKAAEKKMADEKKAAEKKKGKRKDSDESGDGRVVDEEEVRR